VVMAVNVSYDLVRVHPDGLVQEVLLAAFKPLFVNSAVPDIGCTVDMLQENELLSRCSVI